MDEVIFEVTLELTKVSTASIDSLVSQLNEVIAQAVEEQQIEVPDAEIIDYGVRYDYDREYGKY